MTILIKRLGTCGVTPATSIRACHAQNKGIEQLNLTLNLHQYALPYSVLKI
jgi:hypothetical protein